MPRRRQATVVELANEHVNITAACKLIGMDLPEGMEYRRAVKLYCPFGDLFHVDFGVERAFRLYFESNSGYCFAGCGYFTPTRLLAFAWDLTETSAAIELLDHVGHKPVSLAEAWRRANQADDTPDHAALRESLQMFCSRLRDDWDVMQFTPDVAAVFGRCLELLDRVHTTQDAEQWRAGTKRVMTQLLRGPATVQASSGEVH